MMRRKIRYILTESAKPIPEGDRSQFEHQLYRAMLHAIGELSYHKTNPKIIKFIDDKRFILRCSLEGYKAALLALAIIKKLDEKEAAFYTLKSSGTIKALLKAPNEGRA
jgi:RNase P/RNase MRP subunit POP5